MDADLDRLLAAIDAGDPGEVASTLSRTPALARSVGPAEFGKHQTPLHRAIPGDGEPLSDGRLAVILTLLDAGADPNAAGWAPNLGECAPITRAAWGGHASLVRLLAARGADPNGLPGQHTVPIDTAANHDHRDSVEALIEVGARHSLRHLLRAGLTERTREFLNANPASATRPLDDGQPPLHVAAACREGEPLVHLLLGCGADVDARDTAGRSALHIALEQDRLGISRLLLRQGAAIDAFAAAGLDDSARLSGYLPAAARESQADGTTPLFYAAWSGSVECARLLLDSRAEVSPRSTRFWACLTPLHAAIQRRHQVVVRLLVEHSADLDASISAPAFYWPTPLHAAARWGDLEDVKYLLDSGADPNGGLPVAGSRDTGPLSWAIFTGSQSLVELLISRGLDLWLPRHEHAVRLAAESGRASIVRLLVQHGGDASSRDAAGRSPLDIAREHGHRDVEALLAAMEPV